MVRRLKDVGFVTDTLSLGESKFMVCNRIYTTGCFVAILLMNVNNGHFKSYNFFARFISNCVTVNDIALTLEFFCL